MKRTRNDIYSACQSKPRSYRNMSICIYIYEIANIKADTLENIHWIKLYMNNILFDVREFTRSYDGSSNMTGRYNGIKALIFQEN